MKEFLLGLLLRVAGVFLADFIEKAAPLIEKVRQDPGLVIEEDKRNELINEFKSNFSKDDKLIEKMIPIFLNALDNGARNGTGLGKD